jgi:hypothetical protein
MDNVKGPSLVVQQSRARRAENKARMRQERITRKISSMKRACARLPEIKIENRSSMNAVKSGLFARSPVIKTPYYEESEEDFKKLLEALRSSFAPQGAYEEKLVMEIATHAHYGRRGELYEASTVKRNEEARIRQLEEELGICALRQELEAADTRCRVCRRDIEELSHIPEDIAKAAESDFDKYRAALVLIYDALSQHASLATELAMERAWVLGRFHVVLRKDFLFVDPPTELHKKILQRKKDELNQANTECRNLRAKLDVEQGKVQRIMHEDPSRCLLPSKEDLESLDRFYGMHDRQRKKKIEELALVQMMRLNASQVTGVKQIPENGSSSIPKSPEPAPREHSVACVNQQSGGKGEDDHVTQ